MLAASSIAAVSTPVVQAALSSYDADGQTTATRDATGRMDGLLWVLVPKTPWVTEWDAKGAKRRRRGVELLRSRRPLLPLLWVAMGNI